MNSGCRENLISLAVFGDSTFSIALHMHFSCNILRLCKDEIILRNYFSSQELTILQYHSGIPENQIIHIFTLNLYLSGLIFYLKLRKSVNFKDNMKQEPNFLSLLLKNISSICYSLGQ